MHVSTVLFAPEPGSKSTDGKGGRCYGEILYQTVRSELRSDSTGLLCFVTPLESTNATLASLESVK